MPTLRLGGVPEHFNLPWHLALADDLAGLDAAWEDQVGGTGEMLAKLEAGDLDIASILTEGTVAAIAGGLRATILQVYVSSPLQWGVFVPAASEFETEADLAGGRIAISRHGSGSHLMAYLQAERRGWTLEPEQFVVVGGLAGARDSFREGTTDQLLWDRFMTRPLVDAGEFRQVAVQPTPWPSFVIAARDDMLLGRTAEVGQVVDAVVRRATTLHARPGIVDELAQRYGLTPDGARAWLDTTEFAPRSAFDPAIATTALTALTHAGFA